MIKNDFPYPVLRNDNLLLSGYNPEKDFKCYVEIIKNIDSIFFKFSYSTNSVTLQSLIEQEKAKVVFFCSTDLENNLVKNNEFVLKYSNLKSIDEVKCFAQIICKENLDLEYTEEMNDAFNLGYAYSIEKNDVLAISDDVIFSYNRTGGSIIKICKSNDDIESLFEVDCQNDNYIRIIISKKFKDEYDSLCSKADYINNAVKSLINSSILYMAFTEIFLKIIQNPEVYDNKRWYKIIKNNCNQKEINLEEFYEDFDNNNLDMQEIRKLVNSFLDDFFVMSLSNINNILRGK